MRMVSWPPLHFGRLAALLLSLAMTVAMVLPMGAVAQSDAKTVRVGWYESPFNMMDSFGRRSGYAYEYQRKIAAYTGWTYEYVEGSWSELIEKLKNGEIDLMGDVSYTRDRQRSMLFPSIPMGSEDYYLHVASENAHIVSEDYASLNGKRVGVTANSIQKGLFLEWADQHEVQPVLVEVTTPEEVSMRLLRDGQLDAFVTTDAYVDPEYTVPIYKIGSSDYYFAVNRKRPDLLADLDAALSRIQEENRYYDEQLFEKYLKNSVTSLYFNNDEVAWLEGHGAIRVGYQDNYLAFCASDASTGELIGALKDYLSIAAEVMENTRLEFEAIAYPTAAAAIEALKRGEVDCMFPANLSDYDGETLGVVMTPPLMDTEMEAVVRTTDQQSFVHKENVTVAVNEGNPNYDMFLIDHFSGWKTVYYPDTQACLEAVAAGEADCILISSYRFNNIAKQCKKLRLTTVSTGVDLDYSFAVREGNTQLYSVLTRVAGMVPAPAVNAALTYYSTEDARLTF